MMKRILLVLCCLPALAYGVGPQVRLDAAPADPGDVVSLQHGVRTFVSYCLNCHGAKFMRYSRLTDLGLSEQQIKDYLLYTDNKVGQTMDVAMESKDAKKWFGAVPPDLSVIARSRGADWLYTYLRSFYRDSSRPTGWDNLVFHQVGMPHVLYELQGVQVLKTVESTDAHGHKHFAQQLELKEPGVLSRAEYDRLVADLVNFLAYMGEPAATFRVRVGIIVVLFLAVFLFIAYLLKRSYWKDVH
jgi:ubiquinol-cytochrome c reductase cytochrome c1 subunit